MSVFRKENGDLAKKAGIGIVDNILNRFSHNAISNSAVTEAITEINNDLTANTFGNKDSLTLNTKYVAPADGYLRVYTSAATSNYATCEINDDSSMLIQVGGNGIIGSATICFLRKGMSAKLTNCLGSYGATFSPLE